MASGSEADARDAELAALPGEKLVDLLRTTYRRTDFEAVARVLKARDRRFAEVKAALSDVYALRKKHGALLDARRRPRDEAEERAPPPSGIASRDPVRRDEPRVEEVEDAPLSRPLKRPRQCETSALESGKRDGNGQSNSAGALGNYGQKKSSSARSDRSVGPKERTGQLVVVGSNNMPKDSKQGTGAVEREKWGGKMPRTVLPFSPGRSVLPKGSSQSDRGRGRIGKKRSSSDGILGPPPKGTGKIINTSMLKSSSRSANKDTGTLMTAKGGNPIQETRMVASPSLRIGSISGAELRAYCLKPERTPPASSVEIKTQNFRHLVKGWNGLSEKPVDVSSSKK